LVISYPGFVQYIVDPWFVVPLLAALKDKNRLIKRQKLSQARLIRNGGDQGKRAQPVPAFAGPPSVANHFVIPNRGLQGQRTVGFGLAWLGWSILVLVNFGKFNIFTRNGKFQ